MKMTKALSLVLVLVIFSLAVSRSCALYYPCGGDVITEEDVSSYYSYGSHRGGAAGHGWSRNNNYNSAPSAASPATAPDAYPFCNTSLPLEARVADLVERLTLHEKTLQLVNTAHGVRRLGLPRYEWWSEALHGVSNVGPGTKFGGPVPSAVSFPQVILTAASFNATLWRRLGEVVSTEARAMYNAGRTGLTYWSPNVNIFRDPRWGRGQETPGEDPLVASRYAIEYVRGLQSVDPADPTRSLKVAACCKHYTAYDVDAWQGVDRYHFDARVTQQDLQDTFQPPFEACVRQGGVACVMCSYNKVNGVPSCADRHLLTETVRQDWGLDGYVASDCDSVQVMYEKMRYTHWPTESVADAVRAGLDLNCGYYLSNYTELAVRTGLLQDSDIDRSLTYLYTTLMRLGFFDGNPRLHPRWGSLGPDDICSDANRRLALEVAQQGIVLLKNENRTLPLHLNTTSSSHEIRRVAVIGPNADAALMLTANYAGLPCRNATALSGIQRYVDVEYAVGCGLTIGVACNESDAWLVAETEAQAARAVAASDAVVLVMGLDQTEERESHDRTDLTLPGRQASLIEAVAAAAAEGADKKPVVLVIMSGGPVDLSFAEQNPNIEAILWAGYPGEAGGDALASILFGVVSPSGRLPNTWYRQQYTAWPLTDMRMRADPATGYPGRTYRFHEDAAASHVVLYEFGHGLTYVNFSVDLSVDAKGPVKLHVVSNSSSTTANNTTSASCVTLPAINTTFCDVVDASHVSDCPTVQAQVEVRNHDAVDADYTVLLMWYPPRAAAGNQSAASMGAPVRQLVGFERLSSVSAGGSVNASFSLNVCQDLAIVAPDGRTRLVAVGAPHVFTVVPSSSSSRRALSPQASLLVTVA